MPAKKRSPDNEPISIAAIPGLNLHQLVDLLPCYLSIQDHESRILFINRNFKNDFGEAAAFYIRLREQVNPFVPDAQLDIGSVCAEC